MCYILNTLTTSEKFIHFMKNEWKLLVLLNYHKGSWNLRNNA